MCLCNEIQQDIGGVGGPARKAPDGPVVDMRERSFSQNLGDRGWGGHGDSRASGIYGKGREQGRGGQDTDKVGHGLVKDPAWCSLGGSGVHNSC